MSTGNSSSTYLVVDGLIVRPEQHACFCEQCVTMDRFDNMVIAETKKYLREEIDLNTWWDAVAGGMVNCPEMIAVQKVHTGFKEGPITLWDEIAIFVWAEYQELGGHRDLNSERELRLKLEGLLVGYEIRQRTVHKWQSRLPDEEEAR